MFFNDRVILYHDQNSFAVVVNPSGDKSIIVEKTAQHGKTSVYVKNIHDISFYFENEYIQYKYQNYLGREEFNIYNEDYKFIIKDGKNINIDNKIVFRILDDGVVEFEHKIHLDLYRGLLCF
jgi:hypothetical protein